MPDDRIEGVQNAAKMAQHAAKTVDQSKNATE
jgi:hypothetical protein